MPEREIVIPRPLQPIKETPMKKPKWTSKIPNAEGWYWCRYSSKHGGMGTSPGLVVHFKTMGSIICIARVGDFSIHANTRKADMDKLKWLKLKFGPPIPMPR